MQKVFHYVFKFLVFVCLPLLCFLYKIFFYSILCARGMLLLFLGVSVFRICYVLDLLFALLKRSVPFLGCKRDVRDLCRWHIPRADNIAVEKRLFLHASFRHFSTLTYFRSCICLEVLQENLFTVTITMLWFWHFFFGLAGKNFLFFNSGVGDLISQSV